jgi:hypothetical protein
MTWLAPAHCDRAVTAHGQRPGGDGNGDELLTVHNCDGHLLYPIRSPIQRPSPAIPSHGMLMLSPRFLVLLLFVGLYYPIRCCAKD